MQFDQQQINKQKWESISYVANKYKIKNNITFILYTITLFIQTFQMLINIINKQQTSLHDNEQSNKESKGTEFVKILNKIIQFIINSIQ